MPKIISRINGGVASETLRLTCSTTHPATPLIRLPHQNQRALSANMPLPPPKQLQSAQKEGRLRLAISVLQAHKNLRVRRVSALYNTPRSTLQDRLAGALPQAAANAKKRKLSLLEEQSLVRWILDLDRRGFPAQIIDVRRIADVLLQARGQDPPPQPIGKNWVSRWVNSQAELQTK